MICLVKERGYISTDNDFYQEYKYLVKSFCIINNIYDRQYAPYVVLNEFRKLQVQVGHPHGKN